MILSNNYQKIDIYIYTLRILGPSLEGVEPSITRVCTLKTLVFEGADPQG